MSDRYKIAEFLSQSNRVRFYSVQDNCGPCVLDYIAYMSKTHGIKDLVRVRGFILVDVLQTAYLDFYPEQILDMKARGLNPKLEKDRISYIYLVDLTYQNRLIPHYWATDSSENIIDPSGKLQFIDKHLAQDLDNYRYVLTDKAASPQHITSAISKIVATGRNIANMSELELSIPPYGAHDELDKWLFQVTRKYYINRYRDVIPLKDIIDNPELLHGNANYLCFKKLKRYPADIKFQVLAQELKNFKVVTSEKVLADITAGDFKDYLWWIKPQYDDPDIIDRYILDEWYESGDMPPLGRLSYEQANEQCREWHERMETQRSDKQLEKAREMAAQLKPGTRMDGDYSEVLDVGKYRWVRLYSANALKVEGDFMNNCVEGYADKVRVGIVQIYSLWDKGSVSPHITVEIYKSVSVDKDGTLTVKQIEGKANSKPKEEYVPAILDLLKLLIAKAKSNGNVMEYTARGNRHKVVNFEKLGIKLDPSS